MNYIEKAREALSKKIDVEPDLLDLYTLLVVTLEGACTLEDVHNAWAVWRTKTNPEHKSIIPFSELSEKVQEMDREYCDAVNETAKNIIKS